MHRQFWCPLEEETGSSVNLDHEFQYGQVQKNSCIALPMHVSALLGHKFQFHFNYLTITWAFQLAGIFHVVLLGSVCSPSSMKDTGGRLPSRDEWPRRLALRNGSRSLLCCLPCSTALKESTLFLHIILLIKVTRQELRVFSYSKKGKLIHSYHFVW